MKQSVLLLALTTACAVADLPSPGAWREAVARSQTEFGAVHRSDPVLVEVEFQLRPPETAETVHLTGDFANWDATAIALGDEDGDGLWTVTHALRPGRYLYKFVIDGGTWVHDPENPGREDDGHQGFNSVLTVTSQGPAAEPAAQDGRVEAGALHHDPASDRSIRRTGESSIAVTLRTLRGDLTAGSLICGASTPREVSLEFIYSDDLFDHWRADLALSPSEMSTPFGYLFNARDGSAQAILGADGASAESLGTALPFAVLPDQLAFDPVPAWAADAIWYQIFPERFRNGDPSNDHQPTIRWTADWHEPQTAGEASQFYHYVFERQYGGDLQGVIWALPHLQDLGVNAIYLNPVFEAESLHKYETSDYRHIDDNFGVRGDLASLEAAGTESLDPSTWVFTPSDEVFLDLLRQAHARGIRVIIDGVFNHSGRAHWAFRDVLARGQESPFADWYKIHSWDPFEYEGWAGERDLPEWRQDESGLVRPVADHILDITTRWMDPDGDGDPSDGIDGWRLDVPNEVAKPFWIEWCEHVREINPGAYIVGELWGRNADWTTPGLFDAHMNYEWLRGVHRFFVSTGAGSEPRYTPTQFNRYLFELMDAYGTPQFASMQNLLSSHDMDRIASSVINPDRPVDGNNRRQEESGRDYDPSRPGPEAYRRVRLIQTFQFTAVGAPMIWYGDEVGMWGADDPECRKPMLWDDLMPYDNPEENRPDAVMRDHVTDLAHLRRSIPALRHGLFRPLLMDDANSVYAFERRLLGGSLHESAVVALHRGDSPVEVSVPVRWPEGTSVFNAFDHTTAMRAGQTVNLATMTVAGGTVTLTLGPDEGAILVSSQIRSLP